MRREALCVLYHSVIDVISWSLFKKQKSSAILHLCLMPYFINCYLQQKDRAKLNAYANAGGQNGIIMPGRSSIKTDTTPMIYVCATMWHEVEKEMVQFLTSLFR